MRIFLEPIDSETIRQPGKATFYVMKCQLDKLKSRNNRCHFNLVLVLFRAVDDKQSFGPGPQFRFELAFNKGTWSVIRALHWISRKNNAWRLST